MDPVVITITPAPPPSPRVDVPFQVNNAIEVGVPLITVTANQAPDVGPIAPPPDVVSGVTGVTGAVTLSLLRGKTYWCSMDGAGWQPGTATVNVPA